MLRTDIIDRERTQRCRRKRHMKLRLNDLEKTFEQPVDTGLVIDQINEWLGEDLYFSHLEIDGVAVDEGAEDAIDESKHTAKEMVVVVTEAKVFINEVMLSAEEYLIRATPLVDELADQFNQTVTSDNWDDLADLFGGLQWLNSMILVVQESEVCPSDWEAVMKIVAPLESTLVSFEEALETNETSEVGTLLKHQVQPVFATLVDKLTVIIDEEGDREAIH